MSLISINAETSNIYVMLCAIWYHLVPREKTYEGVLLLVKLQVKACNFTKSNTPPWVFFKFLKLHKWLQIAQNVSHDEMFYTEES